MKFLKRHGVNVFILLLFGFFVLPSAIENFSHEGKKLIPQDYKILGEDKTMTLPNQKKNMLIFWATWCGPCHLEMDRLKNSVETGKIKRDQIIALSPFENDIEVKKFLEKKSYPFVFISGKAPLEIKQTPTTVLLDGDKIHSMKSGMSLIGIFLAEYFLNP